MKKLFNRIIIIAVISGYMVLSKLSFAGVIQTVTLPVIVLPTIYGVTAQQTYQYPKTITLKLNRDLIGNVSAYGAAHTIIIAPNNWTGHGLIAADGNRSLVLHSQTSQWGKQAKMSLYIASTGTANALYAAAAYFPWVREHWKTLSNGPLPIKADGQMNYLSETMVKFHLNHSTKNLQTSGVAYSNVQKQIHTKKWAYRLATVTYPENQKKLATAIITHYLQSWDR